MARLNFNKGQSLIEVLLAVSVAIITIVAAVTVLILSLRISSQDVGFQTAAFLGQQVVDEIDVLAERDWELFMAVIGGTDYHLATTTQAGDFAIFDGVEVVTIDGVDYAVSFQANDVNRDGSGQIVTDGGFDDPSTKKIDVSVSWVFRGDPEISNLSKYVIRTANLSFVQSDWSGGGTSPSSDPVFERPGSTFYSADSDIDFSSQQGSIKIRGL